MRLRACVRRRPLHAAADDEPASERARARVASVTITENALHFNRSLASTVSSSLFVVRSARAPLLRTASCALASRTARTEFVVDHVLRWCSNTVSGIPVSIELD